MEDQLLGIHSIMRVHKAFIVNLDQIQEINGNAQGYQLTMRDEKIKIPVSRSYMKKFIAKHFWIYIAMRNRLHILQFITVSCCSSQNNESCELLIYNYIG